MPAKQGAHRALPRVLGVSYAQLSLLGGGAPQSSRTRGLPSADRRRLRLLRRLLLQQLPLLLLTVAAAVLLLL